MTNAIFINGNRQGYAPDQVEDMTMTIEDLICALEEMAEAYGSDAKVFLRNDNGYTYGAVNYWNGDIYPGKYDEHGVNIEESEW